VNVTVNEWLYQPFESGEREGFALVVGAVLSIRIVLLIAVMPPWLVADT
jgi:hypothetical protein